MSPRALNSSRSGQFTAIVWRGLPGGIWALGFGSLLMDVSSEIIHSLLPILMVTVLIPNARAVQRSHGN